MKKYEAHLGIRISATTRKAYTASDGSSNYIYHQFNWKVALRNLRRFFQEKHPDDNITTKKLQHWQNTYLKETREKRNNPAHMTYGP